MKSKTLSKIIGVTMALAVTTSLFSGCGKKEEPTKETPTNTETNAGNKPSADEPGWKKDTSPVTLDWYMNFNWFGAKWGEDEVSKYVEEKTGVKINFIVPAGNENEKVNTMIASGELPDLMTMAYYEEGVKRLIEGKLVYSLNELADKYDPYFYKVANEQTLNWYKKEDGNTYGYPNFSITAEDYKTYGDSLTSNQTFLVRKDIYEAIGKPDMRTPEGFINALKAAKEKFPEINGQPLIPLGLTEFNENGNYSLEGYIQNFLAIPNEKDGKYVDRRDDAEYVRWLKTIRKVNEEGLLAKDVFTDKRVQIEEKVAQGRYFAMIYQNSDMVTPQKALYKEDPNKVYIAVDGPANKNLDKPTLDGPGIAGWTLTFISKDSKNAERAIKFVSYLLSEEGQKDLYLGQKGVHWDTIDGKDQFKPEMLALQEKDTGEFEKKIGSGSYWMLVNDAMTKQWKPEDKEPIKQPLDWTKGKFVSFAQYTDINPPADSPEGIIRRKVTDKWALALPKMVLSKSDEEFDKIYNEFITQKQKEGWDKVLDYQQKRVDENKKKLGIQ
jgi:putative aldouronate transport system substrate-binding protein